MSGSAGSGAPGRSPSGGDPGREGAGPDAEARAREALEGPVREALGDAAPRLAVVLGSGLGGLAGRFEDAVRVPAGRIPGWPTPAVAGHSGEVVAGRLAGVPALGLSGRVHLYEGHPPPRVAFPVRVISGLGVEALFVSNAAGSVRERFAPGELMLIRDHVNLTWRNPLVGPPREEEPRFPDMSEPYDRELNGAVRAAAREEGIPLREGVYAGMLGPSYETPAEVAMLDRLGADAVGMSTVPEVLAARARGVRCFGVSCLTNYAAGVAVGPLDHEEVLETTEEAAEDFQRLVLAAVERLGRDGLI